MLTKLAVAAILMSISTVAIGKPRTLVTAIATKPQPQLPPDKCVANPVIWQIPLGHSEVTISYTTNRGKVLFEREFSVSGGNQIRLRSRGNNGKSED